MTILRVYKPDECDADGNPLDWLRCRKCDGIGHDGDIECPTICRTCKSHGNLRAAALSRLQHSNIQRDWRCEAGTSSAVDARCEDCQHPMSEGTWDGHPNDYYENLEWAEAELRAGCEPDDRDGTHYSRCDGLCNHGRPVREICAGCNWTAMRPHYPCSRCGKTQGATEASWRPVDIRRLSWPMDLRPESLTILCLRCWAVHPQKRAIGD